MTKLTTRQIADARPDGWTHLVDGLQTRIRTPDFATGLTLVAAIGAAAERLGRHPAVDLRPGHVDVRLSTPAVRGVSAPDLTLARAISSLAADAGLATRAQGVSRLELALDSPGSAAVLPFWVAVLAAEHHAGPDFGDELRDPHDTMPVLWFQESGTDEPRQRWHPDVWVDPAEVRPRLDAALAAGGTLVSDAEAPAFWVLADPDGNRVCLCTTQER